MLPVKLHPEQMGSVERELLGSAPLPDLQAHFNNPENKSRFKEWLQGRDKPDDTPAIKGQRGVRGAPAQNGSTPEKAKA